MRMLVGGAVLDCIAGVVERFRKRTLKNISYLKICSTKTLKLIIMG
jgi:hypothetical protein